MPRPPWDGIFVPKGPRFAPGGLRTIPWDAKRARARLTWRHGHTNLLPPPGPRLAPDRRLRPAHRLPRGHVLRDQGLAHQEPVRVRRHRALDARGQSVA